MGKTAQNKVEEKKQNRWDVEFVTSMSLAIELAQALVFV